MPLVAYDKSGNILATLDHLVVTDEEGNAALVDLQAHEAEGRKLNPRGVMILTIYNASQVISKDANAGSAGSTTPVRYLSPKTNAFEVFLQFPHPKGLCQ